MLRGDDDAAGAQGDGSCLGCAAGDDATLSLPPPSGRDASRDSSRDGSRTADAGDSGAPGVADAAACTDTCMQTCGPCAPGSVCELYLSCLVGCGFSDAAFCTDGCASLYPTGPFVAACALACDAECASSGGGDDAATGDDGAAD